MDILNKSIKPFFWSLSFVVSSLVVLAYSIFFHGNIIFNSTNADYIFYYFLALFPLILSIFAILISFTDKDFLKFLKGVAVKEKTDDKGKKTIEESVYDSVIFYFVNNTFILFVSLLVFGISICLKIVENAYLQYLMLFLLIYSTISFIQLIKFIFYFAEKKAEFVDINN